MKKKQEPVQPKGFEIVDIVSKLPHRGAWPLRPLNGITDITLHHSAAPASQTPEQIAAYHVNFKKEPGIAYHYLVYPDGTAYQVNHDSAYTWHNTYNNKVAIGICMVGNFMNGPVPDAQRASAELIILALKAMYPGIRYLVGHREYKRSTLCPGKFVNMNTWRDRLNLAINPAAKFPDPEPTTV
jgi:hypothetical protein